jgi:N4-gp56 family major capsid protein
MAVLGIATDNAVVKKQWDEMKFRETRKKMYCERFMGASSESLIYEQTKLLKDKGDNVTFTVFPRVEAPVILGSSGQSVEGKEGKIESFTDSVTLEEYKTGFRYAANGLDEQRPWFTVSDENAVALDRWASEHMDDLWFAAIQSSPSRIIYGGGKTSVGALTGSDKLTPTLIRRCAALARSGFANGSNARVTYPFNPVNINGRRYFVLVVHPYACYDLKNNAEYQGYLKEARERSSENPIFTGALAVIDDVIIHEHENIQILETSSGSGIYYCTGVLLGAGSSTWVWGKRPVTVDKSFGYDEERGLVRKWISKTQKIQFKFTSTGSDEDYCSAGVYVTVTNVAAAV